MFTILRLAQQMGVYAITHTGTGTRCVGASRHLELRFATHHTRLLEGRHGNRALQAAWDADGPAAFSCTVLDYIEDVSDLFMAERQWKKATQRLFNPLDTTAGAVLSAQAAIMRFVAHMAASEVPSVTNAAPETYSGMDVRPTRHTAYQIVYHLVWCPKYRRAVLTGEVSDRLVVLIREIVPELGGEVIELVVRPDHVHLFAYFPPTLAPQQILHRIKGRTARIPRQEFPSLRSRLPALWTHSSYVGTAGSVSSETIREYIEAQKGI